MSSIIDQFTRQKLRTALRWLPGRRLRGESQYSDGRTNTHVMPSGELQADGTGASGEHRGFDNYEEAPLNLDPLRRRIRNYNYVPAMRRFIRRLRERFFPPPSPEELKIREENKRRQQYELLQRGQMQRAREIMINRLMDLGFKATRKNRAGGEYEIGPEFGIARATPNELIFRCTYFPPGSQNTIDAMASDDVCTAMSESLGHPVTAVYKKGEEHLGLRYFIALAGSSGLPPVYSIADMLKNFPGKAPPLALPFGVRTNGLPMVIDLAGGPHLLGGGGTGKGKSNLIHAFICTLINRNGPDVVQLDILDFKDQGVETVPYENIPHLRLGYVINKPDQMAKYFDDLNSEMVRRYSEFKRRKKRKISDYNRRIPKGEQRMPYLVVFIDEFASCVNELGQAFAERAVRRVAEQGRAVGIHLIIFAQYPKSDVISSSITANISERVAFYLPKREQSQVILQSDSASSELSNSDVGRAIVLHNGFEFIVQTPLVTDRQILSFAAAAKQGTQIQDAGISLDPEEIIRWAIEKNFNRLGDQRVQEAFGGRGIGRDEIRSILHGMDGQEYDIDGTLYVVKSDRGPSGRRVEMVDAEKANAGDVTEESPQIADRELEEATEGDSESWEK